MPKRKPEQVRLPVLPLKDAVIFPHMAAPLIVGRPMSVNAVEESLASGMPLLLLTQQDPNEEDPEEGSFYSIGTAAEVMQPLRMPDGAMKIVVEGLGRGFVKRLYIGKDGIEALVEKIDTFCSDEQEIEALSRTLLSQFQEHIQLSQRLSPEVLVNVEGITDPDVLADTICGYLPVKVPERQALLECLDLKERMEETISIIMRENEMSALEQTVRDRVRDQMERNQREHYLHEQLRVIHQELGQRGEEAGEDAGELRQMVTKAKMPAEVREKTERELERYERMPLFSPESIIVRSYIEWLCDVPWRKRSREQLDLVKAQAVLDEDHYGLKKVKERILEFLAVRKLSKSTKGPILCFVGPPGVGKTSLGQSIARAMSRKFVRVSLGGVRDEAEIRGHRRTYIGALPGRIIQSMKRAGVRNPVFMLDEIDKMSADFRGDPASALLEVLDPAQNKAFSDHFLEVDYDLSEVFFIATANDEYSIPHALHDRMEIIRLSGYTVLEKIVIAEQFLAPRQFQECGLHDKGITISREAMDIIVQRYTREAGVRELERRIAGICRKLARRLITEDVAPVHEVGPDTVYDLLGPPPYLPVESQVRSWTGVAVGLAWTEVGGDTLVIETNVMPGKGKLSLTGRLGEVMKESAEAAYSYLRSHAVQWQLPHEFHEKQDLHVHVPEGGVPKDGPSAGIALVVSMLSALRETAPREALALTGEVTLRGRVLAVGGIKEKLIAAHRAGISKVVLPKANEKDMPDVPDEVLADLQLNFVEHVDEVITLAFDFAATDGKQSSERKQAISAQA